MCAGTVQQDKDDVKEFSDIFGDNGGLIIDSTMGLPDESKVGNVQASDRCGPRVWSLLAQVAILNP
jgi:hypothetical protein